MGHLLSSQVAQFVVKNGSKDNTLKVWDAASGQKVLTLNGHTKYVTSVAYSPDGRRIVSGSHGGTVKVWDVTARHVAK